MLNAERDRAASITGEVRGRESEVAGELVASYARLGSIEEQQEQYDRETAELQAESFAIEAFLRGQRQRTGEGLAEGDDLAGERPGDVGVRMARAPGARRPPVP